jgi:hypothetical protein
MSGTKCDCCGKCCGDGMVSVALPGDRRFRLCPACHIKSTTGVTSEQSSTFRCQVSEEPAKNRLVRQLSRTESWRKNMFGGK